MLYKPLLHCNNHLKQLELSNKTEGFSYKVSVVDMDVFVSSHSAGLGYRYIALGY